MEASFCGPKSTGPTLVVTDPTKPNSEVPSNPDLNYHFTVDDLMEIGKKLCQAITVYN
jgi:hypothetical protein